MIRQTLGRTKEATYSILVPSPDPAAAGMPTANGTGFFVDGSGYFVTARHVIEGFAVEEMWLTQSHTAGGFSPMVQWPELVREWPEFDLALLKVDFKRNAEKPHLVGRADFPHVEVDLSPQEEGLSVYAFGFPLPISQPPTPMAEGAGWVGHVGLGPRTTSAIISSTLEHTKMIQTAADAQVYVLDKALNYGNSGGPIIADDTGKAFAVCSRFQPVAIPQPGGGAVFVPSLYGVVTALSNISADLVGLLTYLS